MERSEIETFVIALIHEQKTIDEDALGLETSLREVGIDSLDALNILFAIEDRFNTTIPDDVARSIETPKDMVSAIENILAEQS